MRKLIFVTFVLSIGVLHAQTTIQGVVADSLTQRPIPYATVYVAGTNQGTATNYNGEFKVSLRFITDSTILTFQSVGYERAEFLAVQFLGQGQTVYMVPKTYEMKEFTKTGRVYSRNPYSIVRSAIRSLNRTIAGETYTLFGSYQNIFQSFEGFDVKSHTVSKVEIKVKGTNETASGDKVKVLHTRGEDDFWCNFRYNSHALLPQYTIPDYGTDHLMFMLNQNPVRNRNKKTFDFVQILSGSFMNNHWFHLDSVASYNGRTTYFVNVFLKSEIRYRYLNVLDFDLCHYFKDLRYKYYKEGGKSGMLSVGKMWVDANDLGIVYFEYYNGFLNDKYKFCTEYMRMPDGKYYPSKMYFANKFWMKKNPDFTMRGAGKNATLQCSDGNTFYNNLVEKYSKKPLDRLKVNEIIEQNTIYVMDDPYCFKGRHYATANSKAAEEILEHFELKEYDKYFHHRILRVDSVVVTKKISKKLPAYTYFDRYMYYLGDPGHHAFLYTGKIQKVLGSEFPFHRSKTGLFLKKSKLNLMKMPPSPILIPITSKDEYWYLKNNKNPVMEFDKEHLIKGYIFLFEEVEKDN